MQNKFILKSINRISISYFIAIIVVFISFLYGVSAGSMPIPFFDIIMIIFAKVFNMPIEIKEPMMESIVWSIRLPRVILAFLVGASLALAGGAFQGLLKNPLADPYTLGVSSGAAFGAVIVMFFGISIPLLGKFTLPIASIIMAFITLLIILMFARISEKKASIESIILLGIIVNAFFGAIISLLIALTGEELRQIVYWLMGSVALRGWDYVVLLLPFFVIGTIILMFNCRELNILTFGENTAQNLGVNVQKRKMLILIGASLLTGASVAVSGTIGFVGLVIPHITRLLWGPDHKRLLPLSMLLGGGFLITADAVARTIVSPQELPIGVLTALIGAPTFAFIFLRFKKV